MPVGLGFKPLVAATGDVVCLRRLPPLSGTHLGHSGSMLHITCVLLQQGLEAGEVAEGIDAPGVIGKVGPFFVRHEG
jgi:hypothetical protein